MGLRFKNKFPNVQPMKKTTTPSVRSEKKNDTVGSEQQYVDAATIGGTHLLGQTRHTLLGGSLRIELNFYGNFSSIRLYRLSLFYITKTYLS